MKLTRDQHDKRFYLTFTEDCFVCFNNEWGQLKGKYNWISVTFIEIYFENEKMTGGLEFHFMLLGLGFNFRWNYNPDILDKWIN